MAQNLNPGSAGSQPAAKAPAKRLIPILLGGAGVVLLGGGGILAGLNSKLTTLQTSAQQKDAEISSSEQVTHRYQATLESYNQTQAHIKYLETSISDKSYVPTLLAQLQGLAVQTHLTVSAVRPTAAPAAAVVAPTPAATDGSTVGAKKAPPPPPYDTLDVAVDVSGSYADTSTFLYSLTRFPKIVSVDSVQMHPGTAAVPGGPLIVMTSLKLTAFMFHDAATGSQPTGMPSTPAAMTTAAAVTPTGAMPPATVTPLPVVPANLVPAVADGTVAGAAGRAASGAAAATMQANTHSSNDLKTL